MSCCFAAGSQAGVHVGMTICKDCKEEIGPGADRRPHCGSKHPKFKINRDLLGIIVSTFFFIIYMINR